MAGRLGKYISVTKGPNADNIPSSISKNTFEFSLFIAFIINCFYSGGKGIAFVAYVYRPNQNKTGLFQNKDIICTSSKVSGRTDDWISSLRFFDLFSHTESLKNIIFAYIQSHNLPDIFHNFANRKIENRYQDETKILSNSRSL